MPINDSQKLAIEADNVAYLTGKHTYYHDSYDDALIVHDGRAGNLSTNPPHIFLSVKESRDNYEETYCVMLDLQKAEIVARDILRRIETIRYLELLDNDHE